jgi:hypothetical protein
VRNKAIFPMFDSLPMGKRLIKGFSHMPCAHQIK